MNNDFVVTISSTKQSNPVHIVLPVSETGDIVYEEIYVLVPVGVVVPGRYSVVLEEAVEALSVAARFLIEGQRPSKYRGLDEWFMRPLDE